MRGTFVYSLLLPFALCLLAGCSRQGEFQPVSMWNDSRIKPLEESRMPGMEWATLPRVPGTVARGEPAPDNPLVTGRLGKELVKTSPVPVTPELLTRGQERFNIFCSPCHSRAGDGEGLIVKRGFPHPPDYALRRLREAPLGHYYEVITNGYGVMYSYASRVPVNDRWAIAAYIRVLQQQRKEVLEVDRWEAERIRAREASGVTVPAQP